MIALAELEPRSLPPGRHYLRADVADHLGCEVVVLRGGDGPIVLALGAVHGDEYEGPAALARLGPSLAPAELRGTLVAIPVLNEPAWAAASRCGPDGLNLARVFPGDPEGEPTERLAAAATALLARCDALIDLHAAGTHYTLHPWAGYGVSADAALTATQRRLAFAFGLDFAWGTPLQPGRTLSAAADLGVPAIYVEMTGAGGCRPEDVATDEAGVLNVLRALGLLDGPYPTAPPRWFRESGTGDEGHLQLDHPAPRAGWFEPAVGVWDAVTPGQPLGVVRDPGGATSTAVTALRAGRVAMLRTTPPVAEGESVAVIVPL